MTWQRSQDKHKAEAKAVGLTLIGPGKEAHYRTYRFNKCKHEQEIQLNSVRRNVFTCRQCLVDELKAEAKAAGLTLLGPGNNSHLRTYRFNKCKHKQQIRPTEIRRNRFGCSQCRDKKLRAEAKAASLTLIGPGRNNLNRTYRFKKCKHEQEIALGSVRDNTFGCRECFSDQLQAEAKAVGLTLIGSGRNRFYRTYRVNRCKHKQEFRTTEIRRNSFGCNICEETSRDFPSNLYLLRIKVSSMEWLKLGYSKTVEERAKTYGLPVSAEITQVIVLPFDSGRAAHEVEAAIHKKYKTKRLSSRKMKKYHTIGGFDECYPIGLLKKLSTEIKKL